MAKKISKKSNLGTDKAMTVSDIKEKQQMLARIGSHKSAGVIFMIERHPGKGKIIDDKTMQLPAKGVLFAHDVSRLDFLANIAVALFPEKIDRAVSLLKVAQSTTQ